VSAGQPLGPDRTGDGVRDGAFEDEDAVDDGAAVVTVAVTVGVGVLLDVTGDGGVEVPPPPEDEVQAAAPSVTASSTEARRVTRGVRDIATSYRAHG
jgi:hypothetical protein